MVSGLRNDLEGTKSVAGGPLLQELELETPSDEVPTSGINQAQLVATFEARLEALEAQNQFNDASFEKIEKPRAEQVNSEVTAETVPIAQFATTASDVSTSDTVAIAHIHSQPDGQISFTETVSEKRPSNFGYPVPNMFRGRVRVPVVNHGDEHVNMPDMWQVYRNGYSAKEPSRTAPITSSQKQAK